MAEEGAEWTMEKDMTRKALSVAFAGLAGVVFASLLPVARQYRAHGPSDWLVLALPLIVPVICAVLSLLLFPTPRASHPVWRGMLWGAFVGGNAFLCLLALSVLPRLDLISRDGTAYWGLASIPCFWIGLPALVLGAGVGSLAGLIVKKWGGREPAAGL